MYPHLTKTCQNRITCSRHSKHDKTFEINVRGHGTAEIGKYHLPYSIKASLSNNASKIRDINLPETTKISDRNGAKLLGAKEEKKKNKREREEIRSRPSFQRNTERKLTNFPRYIGSSRDSSCSLRHEMYSPREETWADKTGSGATGCDRGNQRTHYIAVTEAEEGKLFDITYYKTSSASTDS